MDAVTAHDPAACCALLFSKHKRSYSSSFVKDITDQAAAPQCSYWGWCIRHAACSQSTVQQLWLALCQLMQCVLYCSQHCFSVLLNVKLTAIPASLVQWHGLGMFCTILLLSLVSYWTVQLSRCCRSTAMAWCNMPTAAVCMLLVFPCICMCLLYQTRTAGVTQCTMKVGRLFASPKFCRTQTGFQLIL